MLNNVVLSMMRSMVIVVLFLGLTACGSSNATAPESPEEAVPYEAEAVEEAPAEEAAYEKVEPAAMATPTYSTESLAMADSADSVMVVETEGEATLEDAPADEAPAPATVRTHNRKIIKNGEVSLLVNDTDVAINRSLGIVTEFNGYVISNQTWLQGEFKYASMTIGVPVDNFEAMLRRLKELAVTVTNETASGQDVTDQFVDLGSRLQNLEVTATRLREFMTQAENVEEALRVSAQLSEVEAEISQIKGRRNALKERAAFSTITIQITPQIPTPTPLPTEIPIPTATPTVWAITTTIDEATEVSGNLAQGLFRTIAEGLVWFVVLVLPFGLPVVGLIWMGFLLILVWRRRRL